MKRQRQRPAKFLTREQVREVDRRAVETYGIPSVVLMENAARSVAEVIVKLSSSLLEPQWASTAWMPRMNARTRVSVLCGGGNNGGDGYAIARHLHLAGATVSVFACAETSKLRGDARIEYHIVSKMGLPVRNVLTKATLSTASRQWARAHFVIDALLGTGFTGEVRPHLASVIVQCNALKNAIVVAVDLPSGLDCNSGEPSNATIQADYTVTFVAMKQGFANSKAKPYLGKIFVAGIGAPFPSPLKGEGRGAFLRARGEG